jgi:hypothetical protein
MFWIPIIGPIIQGLVSAWSKSKDTEVAILKTKRESDLGEAVVSQKIIETTKDDIGLRLSRDIICFPIAVWCALVTWDTIVAESMLRDYMWHTAGFDKTSAAYLPYAVICFLLGNIGINMWNRK